MRTASVHNSKPLFLFSFSSSLSFLLPCLNFGGFSLYLTSLFGCTVVTAWESPSSLVSVLWS